MSDRREWVIPFKGDTRNREMEVCPTCEGRGTHVNPSIDSNGITGEEMDELGDEFREDYLTGHFDVRCVECNGANVVPVPTEEESETQRKEYEIEAMYAAERRMGA